uniref:Uncharacterized protein n=1 Tax=Daphnia galeata TaxID=27404 RepID=A0A8J2S418_9CRUS|nr:unnamed protein product [Daphnia galeata]
MNDSIKFILSLIAVIIVGLILMVATGLTVYYGFCPPGRAGSVVDTHSIPNAHCNCPRPSNCTAEQLCPIEPPELCPIHPLMPAPPDPNACILPCCTPPPKKTISQWQPAPPRPVLPKLTEEEIGKQNGAGMGHVYPAKFNGASECSDSIDGIRRRALRSRHEPAEL